MISWLRKIMGERNTVVVGIEKAGSLFFLLNAFLGAFNRRTDVLAVASKDISKSILALAQAVGKDDPVLQAKLDALTEDLKVTREKTQDAIDNA